MYCHFKLGICAWLEIVDDFRRAELFKVVFVHHRTSIDLLGCLALLVCCLKRKTKIVLVYK